MKPRLLHILILLAFVGSTSAVSQTKVRPAAKPKTPIVKSPEIGKSAVVIDEMLNVLRKEPSLYSEAVHRVSRGRVVVISGVAEADGVKFYKVAVPPKNWGWIQADAVFGKFRPTDEQRLYELAKATDGFEKLEIASEFFMLYPNSVLRPKMLLLYGDGAQDMTSYLSKQASSRLRKDEMEASGAPLHSYFLNFNQLDRYRKLGIIFVFDKKLRQYHYDGVSWNEIIAKFPNSPEYPEAVKRIEKLKLIMQGQ
ncbi:MAG: hypothetical protein JNL64_09660 [Blastocatellia bacterium]|nr:hypothetical protein [Blastocatellia bacterium]